MKRTAVFLFVAWVPAACVIAAVDYSGKACPCPSPFVCTSRAVCELAVDAVVGSDVGSPPRDGSHEVKSDSSEAKPSSPEASNDAPAHDASGDARSDAGAIALLQVLTTGQSSATQVSISFTEAAGDLLVVGVCWVGGATAAFAVSDTAGNTWQSAVSKENSGAGSLATLWYAANAHGGANEVTIHRTVGSDAGVGGPSVEALLVEYSGIVPSSPLDGIVSAFPVGSSSQMDAGVLATSRSDDLIVGLFVDPVGEGTMAPGPGYFAQFTDNTLIAMLEDNAPYAPPPTMPHVTAMLPTGNMDMSWVAVAAAFKHE